MSEEIAELKSYIVHKKLEHIFSLEKPIMSDTYGLFPKKEFKNFWTDPTKIWVIEYIDTRGPKIFGKYMDLKEAIAAYKNLIDSNETYINNGPKIKYSD
ncbi:hypothetical protein [Bartonella sp. HY038]|uniref:hypothetical protein n=1 Tax=Bartonella sp. HY038 TaxID=2759660 RepID=UPI0015FAED59|nr:hypothetical protein [Bartonella sp. HY038]